MANDDHIIWRKVNLQSLGRPSASHSSPNLPLRPRALSYSKNEDTSADGPEEAETSEEESRRIKEMMASRKKPIGTAPSTPTTQRTNFKEVKKWLDQKNLTLLYPLLPLRISWADDDGRRLCPPSVSPQSSF